MKTNNSGIGKPNCGLKKSMEENWRIYKNKVEFLNLYVYFCVGKISEPPLSSFADFLINIR